VKVQGAVIKEQGVTFAVVIVKRNVIRDTSRAGDVMNALRPVFKVPIVLMAQDSRGIPEYYGRRDIAKFMASVPIEAVPWKEYTISDS
jgi:hypothetical protein